MEVRQKKDETRTEKLEKGESKKKSEEDVSELVKRYELRQKIKESKEKLNLLHMPNEAGSRLHKFRKNDINRADPFGTIADRRTNMDRQYILGKAQLCEIASADNVLE
ncbi:conserved Plasmodium protein, unknown function [Plasmodium ovale curtisi]|uniref:Uncharacterized protein n=1 Tax=Plasmodium ovale curtisi TaxID=864141 RepID=A0A1A8VP87_PLAOA|nr:conserved Plasmodium protein, unknown function [Plasmodium ovale curtisi]SBS83995.1 conserved Plasmodium protein, unknown function [Plasmodium ovale curtisi]